MPISTVQTWTILDQLVAGKREELNLRLVTVPLRAIEAQARLRRAPLPLGPALRGDTVRLIAELKKASPALGLLEPEFNPIDRALAYVRAGASAISILTEERRFLGSLEHLTAIRDALDRLGVPRPPLLRKDFLFDPYHLFEARAAGADAVLLIVAILSQEALESLAALAAELGLSVLVEVHDEREIERALRAGAAVIGINNRDLRTFVTTLEVTEQLRPCIPPGPIVVSESGIQSVSDIERLASAGVDAVLVGEALMRSGDVDSSTRAFSTVPAVVSGRPLA